MIARWQPPRRLTYCGNIFENGEDRLAYPETYLAIGLEPRGNEVPLTLTHLPILERFEKQDAMGWHSCLDMLEATVRGVPAEPREVHMKRNAARYGWSWRRSRCYRSAVDWRYLGIAHVAVVGGSELGPPWPKAVIDKAFKFMICS